MAEKKQETGACSICGKSVDEEYKPFCSKHCADVDLHRWMGGTYRIPMEELGFITDNEEEEGY